ncbi:c-type cytochrome biogenesis protein CcmI [Mesosutterella sp. OilRF-GAM-744-9]|uniref:C-type cytochrome biogenesis protein CcmI n=1 Tax=Mesosutterella porci TaxID=2915351 RepID=A0ABS9MP81_9BURK|nr:c-type cytochrome biogenesis protein CcmI [Mesosutterella sp. oilRF-744-WT-GAM-9]MCG5030421.1 c-type cytochrome biogenesis protein CcmI [Mesosutterella sp. oilRF-744-WT-GAM-9]
MNETLWFAAAAAGLVAVVLALLFVPAVRARKRAASPESQRDEARKLLAGERSRLEADRKAGRISEQQYLEETEELERRALEELSSGARGGFLKNSRSLRIATALVLAAAVPGAAWLAYSHFGSPEILGLAGGRAEAPTASQAAAVAQASDPASEMKAQAEQRAAAGITENTDDAQLEAWCRAHPGDGRAAVMLARRYADRGQFGPAADYYERALSGDPKARNPVVYTEAAAALISMPEPMSLEVRMKKAVGWLDQAFAMQPDYGNAMMVRSAIAVQRGEWAVAERLFRTMAEKFPTGSAERAQLLAQADKVVQLRKASARAGRGS